MKKIIRYVALSCFALAPTMAQNHPAIEDTLAGITAGKSTFGDLQRRFGAKLIVDQGRRAVRLDGECELFFDFDPDDPKPTDQVKNIQLLNLGRGSEKNSPCNKLATGRGLRLSDSPERVRALYGLAKQFAENNNQRLAYDTNPHCPAGSKATVVLHNFGVEWTPDSAGLRDIDLGITRSNCGELNSQ